MEALMTDDLNATVQRLPPLWSKEISPSGSARYLSRGSTREGDLTGVMVICGCLDEREIG